MPYYFIQNKHVDVVIRARGSKAATRRFMTRYPAYAHVGTYTVRLSGPCIPGVEPRRSPV